jgi:hypothetical protein
MSITSLSSLLGGSIQPGGLTGYGLAPAPQVFAHQASAASTAVRIFVF